MIHCVSSLCAMRRAFTERRQWHARVSAKQVGVGMSSNTNSQNVLHGSGTTGRGLPGYYLRSTWFVLQAI